MGVLGLMERIWIGVMAESNGGSGDKIVLSGNVSSRKITIR